MLTPLWADYMLHNVEAIKREQEDKVEQLLNWMGVVGKRREHLKRLISEENKTRGKH